LVQLKTNISSNTSANVVGVAAGWEEEVRDPILLATTHRRAIVEGGPVPYQQGVDSLLGIRA